MGCDNKRSSWMFRNIVVSIHAPRVGCDRWCRRLSAVCLVSIHAPRVGCDEYVILLYSMWHVVSIHAPRVGCDREPTGVYEEELFVSIHAPRLGCDIPDPQEGGRFFKFQFTHPVWGATKRCCGGDDSITSFQFTHPVWGATPLQGNHIYTLQFQFTHPVWGATEIQLSND